MSWTKRSTVFLILANLIVACLPISAAASIFSGKDHFLVAEGDTIDDDIYLASGEGIFDGVVTGDITVATEKYFISGEIMGNVNSASYSATIRGKIGQSARIFAQSIIIDGTVGNNLVAFGKVIDISESCRIGRDASIFGSEISVAGEIDRDLSIDCQQVIIMGRVAGDLRITAQKISIVAPAQIDGDIIYKSKKEIRIDDDVIVGGEIEWEEVEEKPSSDSGLGVGPVMRMLLFFASLLTGLFIIALAGRHSQLAANHVVTKPLLCLGVGFVAFCATPVAIVVLMAMIIGIPAGIILLFAYTIFFYIAKIYVAIAVGRLGIKAFRKDVDPKQGWSLLFGLIILTILFMIPVLGWIVYFAVIFWGIGAIVLGIRACRWSAFPVEEGVSNTAPPPAT